MSATLSNAVDEGKKIDAELDKVELAIAKSIDSGGEVAAWEELVNDQMLLLRRRLAVDSVKRKQVAHTQDPRTPNIPPK